MEKNQESEPRTEVMNLPELRQTDIEAARNLIENTDYNFRKAFRSQAESMSELTGVELQLDEIRLHCALREQKPEVMVEPEFKFEDNRDQPDKKKVVVDDKSVWHLSDQEILAAVLQESGDNAQLQKFISFYPNIFKANKKEAI